MKDVPEFGYVRGYVETKYGSMDGLAETDLGDSLHVDSITGSI